MLFRSAGELLKSMTGAELVQVSYKGGTEAVTALLGGEIDMAFLSVTAIRAIGPARVKAIGATCGARDPALKSVPAFAESGVPNYDATFWYGLLAPARTPAEVVVKLNRAMSAALREASVAQQLEAQGMVAVGSSPASFRATIRDELAKWKQVLGAK